MLYGSEGTQSLFTGLATQIVYGGCDHDTASFYSDASGTATTDANPDPNKANMRQRPLLTVDEVVTPEMGNCTIFARYVEPAFATQVILTARLTRLYEREDWKARFAETESEEPLLLERGVQVNVQPVIAPPPQPSKSADKPKAQDPLTQAALQAMVKAAQESKQVDKQSAERTVTMTDVEALKRRAEAHRQTVKMAAKEEHTDDTG